MLFPQQNEHRTIHDLSGFWRFLPDPGDVGERLTWFASPLEDSAMLVAVPGAWNEQLAERGLMNYVGSSWYETTFTLPQADRPNLVTVLRIGAANHSAKVWVNGTLVGGHLGGYLPFEIDLTSVAHRGTAGNRLTICVDSRLTMETLPQGIDPSTPPYNAPGYDRRHVYPPTRFDFFPYGGLTRSVQIISLSAIHLEGLAIRASLDGRVHIVAECAEAAARGIVEIRDGDNACVAKAGPVQITNKRAEWDLRVSAPRPWSPSDPYLYEAEITLLDGAGRVCDRYTEQLGFRELRIDGGTILLNGTPLYLVGFGKHEDVPIMGHGQFRPGCLRDFELMRWSGANSFRTSHYPYDEEVLRLADRMGFLVINEAPAVSLGFSSDRFEDLAPLLSTHKNTLGELIARDRNHPSVIAWSPANEPNLWIEPHCQSDAARKYFRALYEHVHSLDQDRPTIAIITPTFSGDDVSLEACDIIGINRYFGWYTDPAELERARWKLSTEMDELFARHGKPIIITECGVDTVEGYHATVAQMFTEEYQTEFLRVYGEVAEGKPFCAGMHVWNFADFLTPQNFRRVVLNRKGVFTRSREPKSAAFFLRSCWATHPRVAQEHRLKRFSEGPLIPDIKPART